MDYSELYAALISLTTFLIWAVTYRLYEYLKAKAEKTESEIDDAALEMLRKLIAAFVLEAQRKMRNLDGTMKEDFVIKELKKNFPQIIEGLGLTDEQLQAIIKLVYEDLRGVNVGGRFSDPAVPPHSHG